MYKGYCVQVLLCTRVNVYKCYGEQELMCTSVMVNRSYCAQVLLCTRVIVYKCNCVQVYCDQPFNSVSTGGSGDDVVEGVVVLLSLSAQGRG